MYQVLNCLVFEHDWRLVVLGGTICWLASAVAISLFHRAKASQGRTRLIWICLDAGVGGCGIWATHFVAMLCLRSGHRRGVQYSGHAGVADLRRDHRCRRLSIALLNDRRSTVAIG